MTDSPAESAAQALADLVPQLSRAICSALRADSPIGLSLRQYRMLQCLDERPHRTSELASASGVTQPTASATVASLEARGLATRRPDPEDRRATFIVLTDTGRTTLDGARTKVRKRLMAVTKDVTEEEAADLQRLRKSLLHALAPERFPGGEQSGGSTG